MRLLRCSATSPGPRRPLRRGPKGAKGAQCRQVVVSVSASLGQTPSSGDGHGPSWPTLQGKLSYIAVLAAVMTIAPACIPFLASGGGGGSKFYHGFGGDGGGGFFNSLVPLAHAADEDDDEDDDETDDSEDDDDDDDDDDEDDDDDDDEDGEEQEGVSRRTITTKDADSGEGDSDIDDDDVAEELKFMKPPDGMDRSSFFCVDVQADGLPVGRGCPTPKELFASLNCQPGFWVSKSKLDQDLSDLRDMGIFKEVEVKIVPLKKGSKSKRMRAIFTFSETFFPPIKSFTILNSKVLPGDMSDRVMNSIKKYHEGQPTGLAVLTTVRNELENWYMDRGFAYCQLGSFEGLDTGNISLTVSEPKIRNVIVRYVDENFQEKDDGGNTPVDLVLRTVSLRPGQFYSQFDGRKALQEAFTLQVFENAQVIPEFIQGVDDQMDVALLLKERAVKTMDLDMEWALSPVLPRLPLPLPMTVVPGGSITYEDRNFADCGDHVSASLMCSNFLHPTDDLSAHVQYRRPFVFGRATDEDLVIHAFNARRLSTVFTSSSGADSVTPVWVERAGAKVGLARHLSRHSNSNLGVVAQQIKTRDDTNSLVTAGTVGGKRGEAERAGPAGPPTTLSGSGIDRTVTLQGSAVRDTTFTVNGALIGSRDVGEVDQGLGLGSGIFNKYAISLTRFLKLNTPSSSSVLAPFVLALHAKHGNCLGPLASYDYHVLGGPHSCRGYSLGELGPARSFLETCVELRAPVPLLRTQAFVFAENARDLGSAADLSGRPREVYNRPGQGSSLGAGVKLGIMRLEWARDCNVGKGTWFVNFGERF